MKKIIIIAGPSGAGKTTISNYLQGKYNIPRVLTHTTRPPRAGEQNGKEYYFETDSSFSKLHLFEKVEYGHYQYGSSQESLQKAWSQHDLVSIILETQGVNSYFHKLPIDNICFIYITISDHSKLMQRLIGRGDAPIEITKRINSSEFKRDLQLHGVLKKYAHIVVNDNWQDTKGTIAKLIDQIQH